MKAFLKILFTGLFLLGLTSQAQAAKPAVLFSDLTDGPTTGWEESSTKGAAVSIWGNNFGSSRGTSYVTVGGVNLTNDSDYAEWGVVNETSNYYNGYNSAQGLQRITFWLNSNMTLGDTTITVTTVDGTSLSIPFHTRNTGNIYFMTTNGSDSNLGNTIANAWQNPSKARSSLTAGDVIYLKGGVYDTEDNWSANIDFLSNNHNNGFEHNSITIASYPGEFAILTGQDHVVRHHGSAGDNLEYWTIAKIILRSFGNITNWGLRDPGSDKYIRFIANDISTYPAYKPTILALGGREGGSYNMYITGNYIHDACVNNREDTISDMGNCHSYGIYLNGYGHQINTYVNYNEIAWIPDGKGIQVYGHTVNDFVDNLHISDNYIHHTHQNGIVLGGGDGSEGSYDYQFIGNAYVYNNIIFEPNYQNLTEGREALQFGGVGWGKQGGNYYIYNNVLIGESSSGSDAITFSGYPDIVELKNNIIIDDNSFYEDSNFNNGLIPTASNNLYFGGATDIPSWESNYLTSDPLFTSPTTGDFSLQSTSPAINAGVTISTVTKDFLGILRPQGSAYDIGAYEYVENQTIRADVDNNSTINTTDALLTLRNSLGLDMSSTDWFTSPTTGDVNCDNTSNSVDAMLILRHSLGLDMTGTGWCE